MARVSRRFVDETLWDEYEQLSTVLRRHLDEVTHRIDQRPNWQRFGVLPMQRSDGLSTLQLILAHPGARYHCCADRPAVVLIY